jgi:hypothetical protein
MTCLGWGFGTVSNRLVPVLALLLLETPLNWIGGVCHEGGHGLVALAQGGTFTGILFTESGSYALASSYLVWIGGWMGQYALAVAGLLLLWWLKPRSFLGRSVLVILIVQNLISEPPYIASLQGDSAAALSVLEAAGFGKLPSIAILEALALILALIGIYVAWRIVKTYVSNVFLWIGSRRASWASLLFVAGSAAYVWFGNMVPSESVLTANIIFQVVSFAAFLVIFSLFVIPRPPIESLGIPKGGPTTATLVFIILLFIEAQLFYFFALPITIPFP